jgi:phage terminase small subunit
MRHGLTGKQGRFVAEYLIDLNATQAAVRAGYSPKVAYRQGFENLRKPQVEAALTEAMAARAQRVELSADAVLREIALVSRSNIQDYAIDDYGEVSLRPGAPPEAMRAVQSLRKKILHTEQGICYETEIKLHPKNAALRMAAEHLGLLHPPAAVLTDIRILVQYAPTPGEVSPPPPTQGMEIAPHIEYTPAPQEA